jgi:hypothetical protein
MPRRTPVQTDDQRHCCGGGDRGAMSVDERVILLESGFDARSRGVNGSRGRAASREARDKVAVEARWQIMMFAAGRVAPALRGRQSCRTNDRSRPTARRTSSGRARGSRASNKPCPRASLLHRVPNKRNRVDARAFGREWFLEKWPSGRVCCRLHLDVMWKVRRTIFPYDATV